jgi:hypothetical protein
MGHSETDGKKEPAGKNKEKQMGAPAD